MIKFHTIEMYEKLAITDGTIKAAEGGTKNWYIGEIANGVVAPLVDGKAQLFENYGKGDDAYTEFVTPEGEFVTAHDLTNQIGKELDVSPESITYADGKTYEDINAGSIMVVGSDGNLILSADKPDSGLYYIVTKKQNFGGNGLLVKIYG